MRTNRPFKKNDFGNRIKEPDVRPLDQRSGKRIKPKQKPDATEQLIFNTGETIEPDYDLEPAYIKKLKAS